MLVFLGITILSYLIVFTYDILLLGILMEEEIFIPDLLIDLVLLSITCALFVWVRSALKSKQASSSHKIDLRI